MKCRFFLFIILFSVSVSSQKKYAFDYMLEYKFQKNDTAKVGKAFMLTNSRDNSYLLHIYPVDSLNYRYYFVDDTGGITCSALITEADLFRADTITEHCDNVWRYSNPFKYQTENYDFTNSADMIVAGKPYKQYILKSNKPKKEKRKKLYTNYYIIEENTDFHLPILMVFPTAYEEWKKEKNIPNGIIKEMYGVSYDGKIKSPIYNLEKFSKANKYLVIPEECNYTDKEKFKMTKGRQDYLFIGEPTYTKRDY